jgi:hypothetical protein
VLGGPGLGVGQAGREGAGRVLQPRTGWAGWLGRFRWWCQRAGALAGEAGLGEQLLLLGVEAVVTGALGEQPFRCRRWERVEVGRGRQGAAGGVGAGGEVGLLPAQSSCRVPVGIDGCQGFDAVGGQFSAAGALALGAQPGAEAVAVVAGGFGNGEVAVLLGPGAGVGEAGGEGGGLGFAAG